MNEILEKYTYMVGKVDSPEVIEQWIIYGDWMLLTSNRDALAELSEDELLTEEESFALVDADRALAETMTEKQLKQFIKQEPSLPIDEWWG